VYICFYEEDAHDTQMCRKRHNVISGQTSCIQSQAVSFLDLGDHMVSVVTRILCSRKQLEVIYKRLGTAMLQQNCTKRGGGGWHGGTHL
jgi:hypothetical protein